MSGMLEGLAACFAGLADPRETRRCDHQLIDIPLIPVCVMRCHPGITSLIQLKKLPDQVPYCAA